MEDPHRAVMAVNTSTCLLVRTVVSVLFMFDRKPESMNRGEFSEETFWPSTLKAAAISAIASGHLSTNSFGNKRSDH
jgi:hypothetical protein